MDSGQREVRYQQLKFLLSRSQAYAKYLAGRIERQKEDLKKRKQLVAVELGESSNSQSHTVSQIMNTPFRQLAKCP